MIRKILLFSILLALNPVVLAHSVAPYEQVVNSQNAISLGVEVKVDSNTVSCSGVKNFYISYPRENRQARLLSAQFHAVNDDRLVLDAPIATLDSEGFHGASICLDSSAFQDIKLVVLYGNGELITSSIIIPLTNK